MKNLIYLALLVFTFSAYAADIPEGIDKDVGIEIVKAESQEANVFTATVLIQLQMLQGGNNSAISYSYKALPVAAKKQINLNTKGRYKPKIKFTLTDFKETTAFKNYVNSTSGDMPDRTIKNGNI